MNPQNNIRRIDFALLPDNLTIFELQIESHVNRENKQRSYYQAFIQCGYGRTAAACGLFKLQGSNFHVKG